MNSSRFEDESLRPTYMSQDEANALMDLWAERQRQDAARQAMITVHDVAEATQLSIDDIQRLLSEVRAGRGQSVVETTPRYRPRFAPSSTGEPTLRAAFARIAPFTGVVAFFLGVYLEGLHTMYPVEIYDGTGTLPDNASNLAVSTTPLRHVEWHTMRPVSPFLVDCLLIYAFVVGVLTVSKYYRRWVDSRPARSAESPGLDTYGIR